MQYIVVFTTGVYSYTYIVSDSYHLLSNLLAKQNSYLKVDLVTEAHIAISACHHHIVAASGRSLRLFLGDFTLTAFPWHSCIQIPRYYPRIIVFFVTRWSGT